MIKATDLIKKVNSYQVGEDIYTDLSLACENVAYSAFASKDISPSGNLSRLAKLTARLEREFLRANIDNTEIKKDHALFKVNVHDVIDNIYFIEDTRVNVSDYKNLYFEDDFDQWVVNTSPFKRNGFYIIKAMLDEYDDGLFCNKFWDFEIMYFVRC